MTLMRELTGRRRMELLCDSFHALRGAPGTAPWNQHQFAKWASSGAPSEATRLAAAFVLTVWNGHAPRDRGWWNQKPYRVGVFDAVDAMGRWDQSMQAAFIAWCQDPFFP